MSRTNVTDITEYPWDVIQEELEDGTIRQFFVMYDDSQTQREHREARAADPEHYTLLASNTRLYECSCGHTSTDYLGFRQHKKQHQQ